MKNNMVMWLILFEGEVEIFQWEGSGRKGKESLVKGKKAGVRGG